METKKIAELIHRRRQQILVHSCIYYRFDMNIIEDSTFDKWCNQLIDLQKKYPEIADQGIYAKEFKSLSHASGFDLPFNSPEVVAKAQYLLRLREEKYSKQSTLKIEK